MVRNYKPKPKTKIVHCYVCGGAMEVGWKTRKAKRCLSCGLAAAVANMQQMRRKSGPYYDQYRAGLRDYVIREGIAYGPPLENLAPEDPDCANPSNTRTMDDGGSG